MAAWLVRNRSLKVVLFRISGSIWQPMWGSPCTSIKGDRAWVRIPRRTSRKLILSRTSCQEDGSGRCLVIVLPSCGGSVPAVAGSCSPRTICATSAVSAPIAARVYT